MHTSVARIAPMFLLLIAATSGCETLARTTAHHDSPKKSSREKLADREEAVATTSNLERTADIVTSRGTITVVLHGDKVPRTVDNFVKLSEKGFYDGLTFHRVIPKFMIQGGCPNGDGSGDPGYSFRDEFHPALRHDGFGVLSMANSGPDTNGSQFFITHTAQPHLDDKHSVFGRVIKGQGVVNAIRQGDRIETITIHPAASEL